MSNKPESRFPGELLTISDMLLCRKALTNQEIVLESKDIILLTKVHIVKAWFSSSQVQMWKLDHIEGWVPKNWRFQLWSWRRLLRVPWTAKRSNASILKETNLEYSLEGLMLKLKLQYFSHLMQVPTHWRRPWCWKRLKAKGGGGGRGWDG